MHGLSTVQKQNEFWERHELESKAKEKEISDSLNKI